MLFRSHLTLAFLGELTDEQLSAAISASEVAAQKATPFEYRLKGLGIFGSPNQPRVIWMGIEEQPSGQVEGSSLQRLHRALNKELEQRGFELEKRPFSPHLTLARVKQPLSPYEQQSLQRLLHSKQAAVSSPFYHVNHLSVMKSELSRSGAKYTCLLVERSEYYSGAISVSSSLGPASPDPSARRTCRL